LRARTVRVVTIAGVGVIGLLDFEGENQVKFWDASMVDGRERVR